MAIPERRQPQKLSEALNDINAAITSTLEMEKIIDRVFDLAIKALEAESAALCLRKDDRWVVKTLNNLPADRVGVSFTDKEAPHARLAVRTKRPVTIRVASADPRTNPRMLGAHGVQSVLTVPLTAPKEAIGVMSLLHKPPQISNQSVYNDTWSQSFDATQRSPGSAPVR